MAVTPGTDFASPEAEVEYKARVARLANAIRLEKTPDRVPVCPRVGFFPAYYSGFTPQDVMYDHEKAIAAWTKCVLEFAPDVKFSVSGALPGRAFEALDYKLYNWPGHGLSPNQPYQCVEREYMKAEDYDALIQDPTDFWLRWYLPRIMGALEPLTVLSPLVDMVEMPFTTPGLAKFGLPEVQAAFQKLLEAGREALDWRQKLGVAEKRLEEAGFPRFASGATKAPFDVISDTLRGTRGCALDMFQRPQKLLDALERITPP